MATSFTSNYQIKLIGTGLESGTWGTSTNENLKRIEQVLGGNKLAFDVQDPGGNSEYTEGTPDELLWITTDTSDSGTAGSEGRCLFVQFTNAAGATTVRVRGSVETEYPNRVFFVWNASGETLTFNCNGTLGNNTYAVEDGAYAVLATTSSDQYVRNLLSALQIDNLVFPAAADVTIPTTTANALTVKDGTTDFIDIDSRADSVIKLEADTLDLSAAAIVTTNQATPVNVATATAAALDFRESGGDSFLTIDTSNDVVAVGKTIDINTGTALDLVTQPSDFFLDDDVAALEVYETNTSGQKMLTFDTSTPKLIVPSGVELELDGTLNVDGTSDFSGVATFSSADIDAGTIDNATIGSAVATTGKFTTLEATSAGAAGLSDASAELVFGAAPGTAGTAGIRVSSNVLQVKTKDAGTYGGFYAANQGSGDGTYFEYTFGPINDPGATPISTSNGALTAHGLGTVPRLATWHLLNIDNTTAGYGAGTELEFNAWAQPPDDDSGDYNQGGISGLVTASSIGYACQVDGSVVYIFTAVGTWLDLGIVENLASWKVIVRAWK
tara:strand:+ start:13214 stop:14881 length:1668 start_codon:yes stop_codon:yes gene_type:complete